MRCCCCLMKRLLSTNTVLVLVLSSASLKSESQMKCQCETVLVLVPGSTSTGTAVVKKRDWGHWGGSPMLHAAVAAIRDTGMSRMCWLVIILLLVLVLVPDYKLVLLECHQLKTKTFKTRDGHTC
jgi:hypothetical protein